MFKCSRTPSTINPLQVSRRFAVTQAVCCVLFLAQPGGPDTHHCIASLICRRSADDPTLTRHHDPTPKLIGRHCCGFDVYAKWTHTPSWGHIFIGQLKSPEKQNTKINITVISQINYNITIKIPATIQCTQKLYKISIIHPSHIHP